MSAGRPGDAAGDRAAVAELLGRAPRGAFAVVVRDRAGGPVVIENAPLLDDGTPMPTRYWLVGRRERELVGRLESTGGVRRAEAAVDPGELAAAHARYRAERDAALPSGHVGPRPSGGVGGTRRGVKCLHAHLAYHLAGGDDPVGRFTAEALGLSASDYVAAGEGEAAVSAGGAVAAIDCGTNSTRLLVVDGAGATVTRRMEITRLGEGVDATGRLGEAAMARTLAVLAGFRAELDRSAVVKARATATSAARDADNAAEFSAKVTGVLGFAPEVLSGAEEGRLAFAGATAGLDPAGGPYLVLDVGGGSTELVGGAGPDLASCSLDIGCVRATERYLHHDPPAPDELAALRRAVGELVDGAVAEHPGLCGGRRLVGVAGTVSALTGLDLGLVAYDRERVHHARLGLAAVERLLAGLAALDVERRRRVPGLEVARADVIVGGAAVLAEAMARLGFDELTASESDLLDGIAAELLAG